MYRRSVQGLARFVPHRIGLRGVQSWLERGSGGAVPLQVRIVGKIVYSPYSSHRTDAWVPSENPPPMFTRAGGKYYFEFAKKRGMALLATLWVRFSTKMTLVEFKKEMEINYEKFNSYYSRYTLAFCRFSNSVVPTETNCKRL